MENILVESLKMWTNWNRLCDCKIDMNWDWQIDNRLIDTNLFISISSNWLIDWQIDTYLSVYLSI